MSSRNPNIHDWSTLHGLSEVEIEETAKAILSEMTLEEKAQQLQGDISFLRGAISILRHYNKEPYPAGQSTRLGIPPMKFVDGPRGVVVGNSTCFPVSIARAATWDPQLEERIGDAMGIEIRAQGGNYFGGVCINLLRHPSWGRAQESYGEDPYLQGEMGVALVKGTQKHVMTCIKHYAVNSMENARFKVDVQIDERTLREIYLPHFKKCIEAGAASVMGAYNKMNGDHCCENAFLLRQILKEEWRFQGFTISDFVYGVRNGVKALSAGLDIEMPFSYKMKTKNIVKWVNNQVIDESIIDDAVLRILRTKLRFNQEIEASAYSVDKIASPSHVELALEAARKSIVLLKNEERTLPLDEKIVKTIAVIGKLANVENTGDRGSSRVYPNYVITPYEGLKKLVGDRMNVILVGSNDCSKAAAVAKTVDAAIVIVGYTHKEEGEYISAGFKKGGDRTRLELPEVQEELIRAVSKVNANTIVVMETGSAVITESWRNNVAAILMAWYPGMEGGTAIAEIIFGKVNPSGKLPVGFPSSNDQLPFFDKDADSITYDFYHGYNLIDREGYSPAFAFGFGLSYTSFEYSNLRLDNESYGLDDTIEVSVDVRNTGNIAGDEIVQLYLGYVNSEVERHMKDLREFQRVSLSPGEIQTITLDVPVSNLAFYNIDKKAWEVEKIRYRILVGPGSNNDDLVETSCQVM